MSSVTEPSNTPVTTSLDDDAPDRGRRRFWVSFVVANVLGAIFLWIAARGLPISELDDYLARTDPWHLARVFAAFIAVYSLSHAARVVRWYDLVRPIGEVEKGLVHRVCIVGLGAIVLLPLRLGEFVRPVLLSRRSELPASSLLATAVVERVVDGLVVTGVLFASMALTMGTSAPTWALATGGAAATLFLGVLTACVLAWWRRDWTLAMVDATFGRASKKLGDALGGLLSSFLDGFEALARGRALGRFLGTTAVYWSINLTSMWGLARFGFGLDISPIQIGAVFGITSIGIMIPGGPGQAGTFEVFMVESLGLFMNIEDADIGVRVLAFVATIHVLQFIVITAPAFLTMWFDPRTRGMMSMTSLED